MPLVQHWHVPASEHEGIPSTHLWHDDATHAPPLDEVDEPVHWLPMKLPPLHVPPTIVQSAQAAAPVPH
jgi:hypothetical protein